MNANIPLARLLVAILAGILTAPRAHALDAESDKPYQLQVVLHVSEHRMLTEVFRDRLKRELRDSLQGALGNLGRVSVVTDHPLLKEIDAKGLEAATDAATGSLSETKAHFIRVIYTEGRYVILARQLDGLTGLPSPVLRREETTDPQYVARAAALLVARDFGVIGTIEPTENTSDIRVPLKAGKLGRLNRWVQKGDLFAVVQIGTVRGQTQAERVPWALLRADSAPQADGTITCRLWQRYKQSLAGRPGVQGYRCIKLGTGRALLRLRLIDEARRHPLSESISIRRSSFDGDADEQLTAGGDGAIVSAKEYEHVAFVTVQSGTSVRARVPVAIFDGAKAVVIPVAANAAVEAQGQFDLRRRLWMSQLYESLLVVDDRFKELNRLVEAKEFDKAMKTSQGWLEELKADLARKEAEMIGLRVAGRESGIENPDLKDGDQRLQEMRSRRDELIGFAAKMKEIKTASEQRKVLLGMVERAKLLESEYDFAKAIELYQQIAEQAGSEPALKQSAEGKRASLEKAWATRDRADVQDFIFKQWPKLTKASELNDQIGKADAMFKACRDAGDRLTPRMLLKTNLAHATRLGKRLKELQKDREEDRREAEEIATVAGKLDKLTNDVSSYLREQK
jgi:hypothetical protein